MGYICWTLFGVLGICAVLSVSTRNFKRIFCVPLRELRLHCSDLYQVWRLQFVVCVVLESDSHWIFSDEVGPLEWSRLRRFLLARCPRHAIGLSMSR